MLAVEGPAGDIDPLHNGRCDRLTAVAVMWPRIEPVIVRAMLGKENVCR
jgi:hypothetical protein